MNTDTGSPPSDIEVCSQIKEPRKWPNDALGRKPLADYLTASIRSQVQEQREGHGRGLTIALDADWGTGKTFFVKEWAQDLRDAQHPVIYFDAWENDIGDEASIALMAAVLGGLEIWRTQLPKDKQFQAKVLELRKRSIAHLRKAVLPATSIVLKGVIRKFVGVGVDEVLTAFSNDGSNDVQEESENDSAIDNTLDALFEKSLAEHETRKESLVSFKRNLTELLALIEKKTEARLPLFIFVDELDRCRPSYAVKLLEEIKHVFGVENVAYIVSTNIEQLQNSVRALYGAGFDGRRYLRRLFDREYSLPTADNRQFADVAVRPGSAIAARPICTGLPRNSNSTIHDSWSEICDAFGLDFRTQKQVFSLSEEVAAAIPTQPSVHALWLFFLSALHYLDGALLKRIANVDLTKQEFAESLKSLMQADRKISFSKPGAARRGDYEDASAPLSSALAKYFEVSNLTARELFIKQSDVNAYDYPTSLLAEVAQEFGGRLHGDGPKYATIRDYARLVQTAGFLTSESSR